MYNQRINIVYIWFQKSLRQCNSRVYSKANEQEDKSLIFCSESWTKFTAAKKLLSKPSTLQFLRSFLDFIQAHSPLYEVMRTPFSKPKHLMWAVIASMTLNDATFKTVRFLRCRTKHKRQNKTPPIDSEMPLTRVPLKQSTTPLMITKQCTFAEQLSILYENNFL